MVELGISKKLTLKSVVNNPNYMRYFGEICAYQITFHLPLLDRILKKKTHMEENRGRVVKERI